MREAPALVIIEELLAAGATVQVYDPKAMERGPARAGRARDFCQRSYDAAQDADALLVVTEWAEFREPDFERIKRILKRPAIFDGRNIYNPQHLKELGFHYEGIGRR